MRKWFEMKSTGDKSAEILLYGPIGKDFWTGEGMTAKDFDDALKALGEVDSITLRINSPGGDVFDGLAIHNMIKTHPAKVAVQVDGIAASAASFVAMAGDSITIPDNAFMLIHSPRGGVMGTSEEMLAMAADLDRMNAVFADTYAARTGGKMDAEKCKALMKEDRLMTASEARDFGFADAIEAPVIMSASFDLGLLPPKARYDFKAAILMQAEEKKDEPAKEGEVPPEVAIVNSAKAETKAEFIAYATEVRDICAVAGADATEFIIAQTPIDQVRAALVDARAAADEEIVGQHQSAATRPAAASWKKTIDAINERNDRIRRS